MAYSGDFSRTISQTEVLYDSASDVQAQPSFLDHIKKYSRLWNNAMVKGYTLNYTDEASLNDPQNGWQQIIDRGANIIQTEDPGAMMYWIAGNNPQNWDSPTRRVQAEKSSSVDGGPTYYDVNSAQQGDVGPSTQGLDVCDLGGATSLCWIRETEWVKYTVLMRDQGTYDIKARVSTPYTQPNKTNTFVLEFRTSTGTVTTTSTLHVPSTAAHEYFRIVDFGSISLPPGTTEFTLKIPGTAGAEKQNFNIDYFQFDQQ